MHALDRADLEVLYLLHLVAAINVAAFFARTTAEDQRDPERKNELRFHDALLLILWVGAIRFQD